MLFNSIDFAIFLPIVFVLYWFVTQKNLTLQNALIVIASFVFYGWWDWRFLTLILLSTIVDFSIGLWLNTSNNDLKRKLILWISLIINLGFLGFFKYYNFFLDNFVAAFSFFGKEISPNSLNIILPVGISFYTFQTLSYTIDVYRRKLTPTDDIISFAAYVSFFPQLVAGPIERATNLLPQFYKKRTFDYAKAADGMRQILWGLFKKVVIADNCAEVANTVFNNAEHYSAISLIVGAVFFTFQIYCDFSGYSDIAIGSARLFGFDLMKNFAFPYFSRDIAEFWRRWHISLSTWFRDYLYIPLGGSRGSTAKKIRNIFIIFVVSGLWHGANWTFIVWGALNAIFFLPLLLTKTNRNNIDIVAVHSTMPSLKEFFQILSTFTLTVLAWIFFRAENIQQASQFIYGIFSHHAGYEQVLVSGYLIIFLLLFILIEWRGRKGQYAIEKLFNSTALNYTAYYLIIIALFMFSGSKQQFIYFQF